MDSHHFFNKDKIRALILTLAFLFTSFPAPADAATTGFYLDVLGYGILTASGSDSGKLRIGLALIYNYNPANPELRADQTIGKGVCQGDSAGPAFLRLKNHYYVLGVASATHGFSRGLSSFSSTVYFQKWIAKNLQALNSGS